MLSQEQYKMSEIELIIGDELFTVKKAGLCEHSDYFRAMFSGNYIENNQEQIEIEVVDSNSMKIIMKYMKNGLIDLTEYPMPVLRDLAISSNFLQIVELVKQLEFTLDSNLSLSNWVETMSLAEAASYAKLEKYAAAYGLLHFNIKMSKYIPDIIKLHWYLSHPYLNANSELEVFQFGFQWVSSHNVSADAFLVILGCLDLKATTKDNFREMKLLLKEHEHSLAAKVVDCLYKLANSSLTKLIEQKECYCQKFTSKVYEETVNLVRESKERQLVQTPCALVSAKSSDGTTMCKSPQFLHIFSRTSGFESWIEIPESRNLWGWSIASWGPNKLVVVGGEYGRGTGLFSRQVAVWDTLRKEWTKHGVELPPRRHSSLVVIDDTLYIIGGVGSFRVVQTSVISYDLAERTFRKLKDFPDAIQNPPACAHKGKLYVGGHKNVFRYYDVGETDTWEMVLKTDIRLHYMVSMDDYIYATQNYFNYLFRFRPDQDETLDMFLTFSDPVAALCCVGKSLIAFSQSCCHNNMLKVEEYKDNAISVLWTDQHDSGQVNDAAGCCALVLTIPPINTEVSQYPKKYLKFFIENEITDTNCK